MAGVLKVALGICTPQEEIGSMPQEATIRMPQEEIIHTPQEKSICTPREEIIRTPWEVTIRVVSCQQGTPPVGTDQPCCH